VTFTEFMRVCFPVFCLGFVLGMSLAKHFPRTKT
jgi:hypothetical protein